MSLGSSKNRADAYVFTISIPEFLSYSWVGRLRNVGLQRGIQEGDDAEGTSEFDNLNTFFRHFC